MLQEQLLELGWSHLQAFVFDEFLSTGLESATVPSWVPNRAVRQVIRVSVSSAARDVQKCQPELDSQA